MKYFAFILGLFAICTIAIAQENNMLQTEVEEQYFQNENQNPDKSIIYVFFDFQFIFFCVIFSQCYIY